MASLTVSEALCRIAQWVSDKLPEYTNVYEAVLPPADADSHYPFIAVFQDGVRYSFDVGDRTPTVAQISVYLGKLAQAQTTGGRVNDMDAYQQCIGSISADIDALVQAIADSKCKINGNKVTNVSLDFKSEQQPKPAFIAHLSFSINLPPIVGGDLYCV